MKFNFNYLLCTITGVFLMACAPRFTVVSTESISPSNGIPDHLQYRLSPPTIGSEQFVFTSGMPLKTDGFLLVKRNASDVLEIYDLNTGYLLKRYLGWKATLKNTEIDTKRNLVFGVDFIGGRYYNNAKVIFGTLPSGIQCRGRECGDHQGDTFRAGEEDFGIVSSAKLVGLEDSSMFYNRSKYWKTTLNIHDFDLGIRTELEIDGNRRYRGISGEYRGQTPSLHTLQSVMFNIV